MITVPTNKTIVTYPTGAPGPYFKSSVESEFILVILSSLLCVSVFPFCIYPGITFFWFPLESWFTWLFLFSILILRMPCGISPFMLMHSSRYSTWYYQWYKAFLRTRAPHFLIFGFSQNVNCTLNTTICRFVIVQSFCVTFNFKSVWSL